MQELFFEDFFTNCTDMRLQKHKILLFVYQRYTYIHTHVIHFKIQNVRMKFSPANYTSKVHVCDLGIIRLFKVNYTKPDFEKFSSWYKFSRSSSYTFSMGESLEKGGFSENKSDEYEYKERENKDSNKMAEFFSRLDIIDC